MPMAPRAFPTSESSGVRRGRGQGFGRFYVLHGMKELSAPTGHVAATHEGAANGGDTVLPDGGMLEGGQPIRLDTQRNQKPTRPHRHSHSPSDLKVRPPAGGPALDPASPWGGRPVCMYDVAGAAVWPRDRRAHRAAPGSQQALSG